MYVLHNETLKAVLKPQEWEMTGDDGRPRSGVTYAIQTEYQDQSGAFQLRKVKIDRDMVDLCSKLVGKPVDIVVSLFAKGGRNNPYIDHKAIQAPRPSRAA